MATAPGTKLTPSERFAKELADRGWSLTAAARVLDCTPAYVSSIKTGKFVPGFALAARIERAFGIPCIDWIDEKPKPSGRQGRRPKPVPDETPAPKRRRGRPRKAVPA